MLGGRGANPASLEFNLYDGLHPERPVDSSCMGSGSTSAKQCCAAFTYSPCANAPNHYTQVSGKAQPTPADIGRGENNTCKLLRCLAGPVSIHGNYPAASF